MELVLIGTECKIEPTQKKVGWKKKTLMYRDLLCFDFE